MISSGAPGGRERRKHRRFEISKRVTIIHGDLEIEGVLQDISVGGAAIECSAALDAGLSYEIDIEDIGTYPANVVRRIDSDVVAVRFTITEALAVRMAARIAAVYVEDSRVVDSGPKLNTIEVVSG
ncbi:MAG: hypothetical protein CMM59_10120 [Rhodospirillaceae bacterium]|nr:hypothetical protein [Rhodospirillaceae bacterium]|tara:strand:+ start:19 stop:396 length:378 start_codon:yes stop_codon:yes gene_type:complete